jgi:sodium-dependent phosphate cotransporter
MTKGSKSPVEAQASTEEDENKPAAQSKALAWAQTLGRLALFVVCLALFVLALDLMKSGAGGAATLIGGFLDINNVPNALGFGWLATYLVLSGSPVAAVSVTFLATGALQQLPAYAMLT